MISGFYSFIVVEDKRLFATENFLFWISWFSIHCRSHSWAYTYAKTVMMLSDELVHFHKMLHCKLKSLSPFLFPFLSSLLFSFLCSFSALFYIFPTVLNATYVLHILLQIHYLPLILLLATWFGFTMYPQLSLSLQSLCFWILMACIRAGC